MLSECLSKNSVDLLMALLPLLLMAVEYWLGKTDKTKSASIIELIYNILSALLTKKKP